MINKKISSEIAVGIIFVLAIAIGGIFWLQNKKEKASGLAPATSTQNKNSQLANPAAIFCEQNGGKSVVKTNPDSSQTGYCVFPNGKECEEWAFFQGKCSKNSATDEKIRFTG